jgi:hypothetical protein
MTLDESIATVGSHLARMDTACGQVVFDEWALVTVFGRKARILHYSGPRRETMPSTLAEDLRPFAQDMGGGEQYLGHFDFSPAAVGRTFDAYVVVGEGVFLICNNTTRTMADIRAHPDWKQAQVPFAELSERFRTDPLMHFA